MSGILETAISQQDLRICADALENVRARNPRVHCITNSVVQNFTANMLLAFGGIPSMTINPDEVGAFVIGADALLLNLGTVDGDREIAIPIAMQAAKSIGLPVVLDPVFIDRSPGRAEFARALAVQQPDIVRANRGEWNTLVADGTDTGRETDEDEVLASPLLKYVGTERDGGRPVGVLTGAVDLIAGVDRTVSFKGGHRWMSMITGVGCGQAAIMGALAACCDSSFHAALTGVLVFGLCGERAAEHANGPGSFEPALLDALYALDPADFEALADRL